MAKVASRANMPNIGKIIEIVNYILELSETIDLPPDIVMGIVWQESKYDAKSYRYNYDNPNDRSYGLMHLTLPTAKWILKYDKLLPDHLFDPIFSLYTGMTYLKYLMDRYGDIDAAIAAYNMGSPKKDKSGRYVNAAYLTNVYNGGARIMDMTGTVV